MNRKLLRLCCCCRRSGISHFSKNPTPTRSDKSWEIRWRNWIQLCDIRLEMIAWIVGAAIVAVLLFIFWPRQKLFDGPMHVGIFPATFYIPTLVHRQHKMQLELHRKYGTVVDICR